MVMTALSSYILIKVPKAEEIKRREMDRSLYLHPNYVYMTRNTQCGVIESISKEAKREFPEATEGDMLLFHHFVQRSHSTKGDNDKFLVTEDEENRYYKVPSKEWGGHNNMAYGILRDGKIIPHSQYVFLEKEIENKEGWYETPDEVYEKIANIKTGIENLSKTKFTPDIILEIKKREGEMMQLNLSLQTKEYLPYKIAFANKALGLDAGSIVFALNIACQNITEWAGISYRVVDTKYIAAT